MMIHIRGCHVRREPAAQVEPALNAAGNAAHVLCAAAAFVEPFEHFKFYFIYPGMLLR